jgi:acetylglutamate/LysW-gamma-L-alpha-aminoadipate kinase
LIQAVKREEIEQVTQAHAQGRMRIKLLGAQEALAGGVRRVVLSDGRCPRPLHHALAGDGTVIV